MPIVLINRTPNDILVTLEQRKSAKPVTHRNNATMPTFVKVPARRTVNVEGVLGLDKATVLDVLNRSPELQTFLARKSLVLVDEEAVREKTGAATAAAVEARKHVDIEKQRETLKLAEAERLRHSRMAGHVPEIQKRAAQQAELDEAAQALVARVIGTSDGLDTSLQTVVSDNTPSTKWATERLAEYAKERGIKVEGLSKNAILRELRKHNA